MLDKKTFTNYYQQVYNELLVGQPPPMIIKIERDENGQFAFGKGKFLDSL
jgi:hypothetical protein